jgi:hypothetical protein
MAQDVGGFKAWKEKFGTESKKSALDGATVDIYSLQKRKQKLLHKSGTSFTCYQFDHFIFK